MKKALRNLFWIAIALGAIGLISDNCNRAEACPAQVYKLVDDFDGSYDLRCWQGDCVIYEYNGVISEECKTFCNFYCYHANYVPHCNADGCVNQFQHYCRIDGGPHWIK